MTLRDRSCSVVSPITGEPYRVRFLLSGEPETEIVVVGREPRGPRDATRAVERIIRADRELDSIRSTFAMRGWRAEIVGLLYEAEAILWKAIDIADPTVRMVGWKAWLDEQEAR